MSHTQGLAFNLRIFSQTDLEIPRQGTPRSLRSTRLTTQGGSDQKIKRDYRDDGLEEHAHIGWN